MRTTVLLSQGNGQGQTGHQKENFTENQQSSRPTLTPKCLRPVPFGSFLSLLQIGVRFQLPKVRQFLSRSPDIKPGKNGRKNSQTIENNRQKSGGLTEDRSAMGSVAAVCLDSSWLRSRARFRFGLSSNSLSIELNLHAVIFLLGLGRLFRLIFR